MNEIKLAGESGECAGQTTPLAPSSAHTCAETPYYCATCAQEITAKPWPVEPLYTTEEAALMVPLTSANAVRRLLHRHKELFPARYRFDRVHHAHRLLTAMEIRMLRDLVVRGSLR